MTGGPVCRPYGIPETLVYSVGADDTAARTFTEISRHLRADEDIRPYGKCESPVHFIEAASSAARLFMEGSPLPAGGASPSPTVSSKGSTHFVGTKHSARGEIGDGRPSVPPLRILLWLPHLIVGAHIMRPRAGNTRPYAYQNPSCIPQGPTTRRPARLWKSLVIGGRMRTSAPTANMDVRCILQVPAPRRPVCSWKIPYYRR